MDEDALLKWMDRQSDINGTTIELLTALDKRLLAMETSIADLEKRARKVLGELSES